MLGVVEEMSTRLRLVVEVSRPVRGVCVERKADAIVRGFAPSDTIRLQSFQIAVWRDAHRDLFMMPQRAFLTSSVSSKSFPDGGKIERNRSGFHRSDVCKKL